MDKAALFFLLALAAAVPIAAQPSTAPVRRALLVGIGEYAEPGTPASANALSTRGLGNLEGPVHDVESIRSLLVSRFGFRADDIVVLTDGQATRAAILDAISRHLGSGRRGDQAFFFYAGHGSWVENSRSSEADRRDETIVPADAARGVADIRDKELRAPFHEMLERGLDVTLVFDACHSGSITRAVETGLERSVRPAPGDVADDRAWPAPPQDHPSGRALVFSAARDDQKAREFRTESGVSAGAFTWSFVEALRETPGGVPAEYLFQQVRARMKARGFEQDPVFEGGDARRREPLFADPGGARFTGTVIPVLTVGPGAGVLVQAGWALGLARGAELVSLEDRSVRVRIDEVIGLSRARGTLVAGAASALGEGTLLTVDRWAASAGRALRLHLPPAVPDAEDGEAVYRRLSQLRTGTGFRWVEDPSIDRPTHLVEWDGAGWFLAGPGTGRRALGVDPSVEAVLSALQGQSGVRLFVAIPPSSELDSAVRREFASSVSGVALSDAVLGADYSLVGTVIRGERKYYWMHRGVLGPSGTGGLAPTTEPAGGLDRTVARALAVQAGRLARAAGWLALTPPSSGAVFPYRITGFERVDRPGRAGATDTLAWGGQYRVILEAPRAALETAARAAIDGGTARWHWYLFAMDRQGNGTLLYPRASNQPNQVNLLARDAGERTRIAVPDGRAWLFSPTATVAGARDDFATLFLLASAEVLPDPVAVLNFTGVGSRAGEEAPGGEGSLSAVLFELGGGTRSSGLSAPVTWDLQKAPLISAPAR